MRRLQVSILISLILCMLQGACQLTPSFQWKKLDIGIEYASIKGSSQSSESSIPYQIHAFRFQPENYTLKALYTPDLQRKTIEELTVSQKALVGINANFFDPEGKILGLVIDEGKVVHPFKPISWWSIFYMKGSQAGVMHSSEYKKSNKLTTAIQAGPRLIVNGAVPQLKKAHSAKSVIGIDRQGRILILASRNPIEISELATLLVKPEAQGGLNLKQALNLDGGSSTQLYAISESSNYLFPVM